MSTPVNTIDGPREMLPREYDETLDLMEQAYGSTREYSLNSYPQLRRENFAFKNHFVIREGGRLVSHVGLYPMEAIADNDRISVGGIGDVASHPDCQGKGYMVKLLDYSLQKMRERKIPLSILWGDTQRYRRFGWETAGREIVFNLTKRSARDAATGKDFIFRGYGGREIKDLERIMEIHEREPLRIKRSSRDYKMIFNSIRFQTWMGHARGEWVYAAVNNGDVLEFGGEASRLAGLFALLVNRRQADNLQVHVPYKDSELLRMLYKISDGWRTVPLGMIKIVDLRRTLLSFKGRFCEKARLHRLDTKNLPALEMTDSRQIADLIVGPDMKTAKKRRAKISLSDIEMVRLLFGATPEQFAASKEQERLFTGLFPLDFYLPTLDRV